MQGPTASLTGTVRPAVRVRVCALPASGTSCEVRSDGEGRFSFPTLPPGPCTLLAADESRGEASVELVLQPGPQACELALPAWRETAGRVQGPAGEPLAGLVLDARVTGPRGLFSACVTSDEDGSFALPPLPEGRSRLRVHDPEERYVAEAPGGLVPFQPGLPLALTLQEAGAISGRVVAIADGRPIEGVRLEVLGRPLPASAAADGRFRLAPLPPGRYRLRASAPGYLMTEVEARVRPGRETCVGLLLALGAVVWGRLREDGGAPLARAAVVRVPADRSGGFTQLCEALRTWMERGEAPDLGPLPHFPLGFSDALGNVELSGLPFGPNLLRVIAAGRPDRDLEVDVDRSPWPLVLEMSLPA